MSSLPALLAIKSGVSVVAWTDCVFWKLGTTSLVIDFISQQESGKTERIKKINRIYIVEF